MINGGKVFLKRVHRLIAETYLKKDRDRPFVNHKNGIKDDNRIENLEWVSRHENDIHKNRVLGLVVRHKLTAAKTIEIYNLKDSGRSQESVAVQYGISRRMVGMIWRHERGAMVTINAPNKNSL